MDVNTTLQVDAGMYDQVKLENEDVKKHPEEVAFQSNLVRAIIRASSKVKDIVPLQLCTLHFAGAPILTK